MCGRNCDLFMYSIFVSIFLAFSVGSVVDRFYYWQVECRIKDVTLQEETNFNNFNVDVKIIYLENDNTLFKINYHVSCECRKIEKNSQTNNNYICQNECFRNKFNEEKEKIETIAICNQHHEIASMIYRHQYWYLSDSPRTTSNFEMTMGIFTLLFIILWTTLFYNRYLSNCCRMNNGVFNPHFEENHSSSLP